MPAIRVIFKAADNLQSKLLLWIRMPIWGGKRNWYFNLYFVQEDTETPVDWNLSKMTQPARGTQVFRLLGEGVGGQGPGTYLDGAPDAGVDKAHCQPLGTHTVSL